MTFKGWFFNINNNNLIIKIYLFSLYLDEILKERDILERVLEFFFVLNNDAIHGGKKDKSINPLTKFAKPNFSYC